jgi:uncharacterized protein involved in outer membrane biogenesis
LFGTPRLSAAHKDRESAHQKEVNGENAMRWKWVVGIAAVLIIVLVATAYLILATYDYNKLKPRIAQAVRDATGRELTLGGDIELAIGLSPSLVVADVMFANAPWGSQPQMMKAEKLQAQVQLLPLLFGDAELEGIALIGMDVSLETDATGKGNWEFKTGEKSTKSFWTLKELEVDNVKIVKLNLTIHDGKTGSTTRFGLDSLDAWHTNRLRLSCRGRFRARGSRSLASSETSSNSTA